MPVSHAAFNAVGMRKFRRAGKAPITAVEAAFESRVRLSQRRIIEHRPQGGLRNHRLQRSLQLLILCGDLGESLQRERLEVVPQRLKCRRPMLDEVLDERRAFVC